MPTLTPTATVPPPDIVLYDQINLGGTALPVTGGPGIYPFGFFNSNGWNDRVESFTAPSTITVQLCLHGNRVICWEFTGTQMTLPVGIAGEASWMCIEEVANPTCPDLP